MEGKFLQFQGQESRKGKRLDIQTRADAAVPESVAEVRKIIAHDTATGVAAMAADEGGELAMSSYEVLRGKVAEILWRAHEERMHRKGELLQSLLDARAQIESIDKSMFTSDDYEIAERIADELAAKTQGLARDQMLWFVGNAVKEWR